MRWLGRAQALRAQLARKAPPPAADALLCSALALCWDDALAPYAQSHHRHAWPIYQGTNAIVRLYTDARPVPRLLRQLVLQGARRQRLPQGCSIAQLTQRCMQAGAGIITCHPGSLEKAEGCQGSAGSVKSAGAHAPRPASPPPACQCATTPCSSSCSAGAGHGHAAGCRAQASQQRRRSGQGLQEAIKALIMAGSLEDL
jgi:hypothetical protein